MSIISMCETTAQHHSEGNPITIHFLRVKLIATNIMGVALNVIRVHPSGHFIATKGHIYVMHSFFMLLERVPADHSANGPTKTGNGCSETKKRLLFSPAPLHRQTSGSCALAEP